MANRRGFAAAAAAALVSCTGIGCDRRDASATTVPAPSSASPAATPAGPAEDALTARSLGLAAPDNDAALVALLTQARACAWNGKTWSYDGSCAAWNAWREADVPAAAEPTLVNLVDDADVNVRALGAYRLAEMTPKAWNRDKALVRRVIDAAAREPPGAEMGSLGGAVARIDFRATGTWPAAKAALTGTKNHDVLLHALIVLIKTNETDVNVWEFEKEETHSADPLVATFAVEAFAEARTQKADACGVWVNLLDESDNVASAAAARIASTFNACGAALDTLLDHVKARAQKGAVDSEAWPGVLVAAARNHQATSAQRQRAATILAMISATASNTAAVRTASTGALKALAVDGVKPL